MDRFLVGHSVYLGNGSTDRQEV